ncbi:hypothetical protein EIN_463820 [Entamoeba invadens IP1]|uniref:PiggyBac transposable element-derived protein domain-containing protein n=1 Tax=Entamoeba invadens IP1 TaxID=370355 RepID=L7FMW0_ENTIV|nr:hypothetical protein EIN_463820 [Entamoeba invadens IP1]ELP87059.1 hypothetical protein EIN_463820 [Entamoeba invadens IP1]|eukprot:XP_004253830.1 hypothetical protein EIN_463820 [Entamoeba invadens IP1]
MQEDEIVGTFKWKKEGEAPKISRHVKASPDPTYSFDPKGSNLTEVECFRYLGILLYMGAHHDVINPVEELWSIDHGKSIYRNSMPRDMFKFISSHIETYDVNQPDDVCDDASDTSDDGDVEEKEEADNGPEGEYFNCAEYSDRDFRDLSEEQLRKDVRIKRGIVGSGVVKVVPAITPNAHDSFSRIRVILDKFISNLVNQTYYKPSNSVSVDEHLCSYKGHMWAKVFIKSKPGRYGIKFWMCADCETGMTLNLQLYCGKCGGKEDNQGFRVVRDMVLPMLCRGNKFTVVCDNFFCTLRLSHYLASCGCQLLGTMRINRKELPDEAKTIKGRTPDTTIFFSKGNCKLISYFNEKKKLVLVLSTCHEKNEIEVVEQDVFIGKEKMTIHKPQPILDYNHKMGGVDTVDQMTRYYTCRRRTNRWNIRALYDMIDIAALNAYKTYSNYHPANEWIF